MLASHPFPVFMNGAAALAIYLLLQSDYVEAALLCAAVALAHASIGTMNDCVDLPRDMVSQSDKPLVRGYLSVRQAWRLTAVYAFIGAGVAFALGAASLLPFFAILLAGYAYNYAGKGTLWSWVPYAVSIPTLPVWAFLVADRFHAAVLLSYLVGAPMSAALNVANTLPDLAGDAAHELRGLAHVLGPRRGLWTVWACLVISLAAIVLFAMLLGRFHGMTLLFAVAAATVIAATVALGMPRVRDRARLTWYGTAISSAVMGLAWTAALF